MRRQLRSRATNRHERAQVSTPWEDQASSTPQRWQGATSSTTVWTSSSREGTHSNEPHDRRPATPVAGSTQAVTLADPMTGCSISISPLTYASWSARVASVLREPSSSEDFRASSIARRRRCTSDEATRLMEFLLRDKSSRASRQTGLHHDQSTGLRHRGAEAGGRRPGLVGPIRSAATYRPVIATRDSTTVR